MKKDRVTQSVIIVLIAVFAILMGWTLVSRRSGGGQNGGGAVRAPVSQAGQPAGQPASQPGDGTRGAGQPAGNPAGNPGGEMPPANQGGSSRRASGGGQGEQAGGIPGADANQSSRRSGQGQPAGQSEQAGASRQRQAGAQSGNARQTGAARTATAVRVLAVSPGSIENTIVVNGDVQAARQVQVYPIAAGKIIQLPVRLGGNVRQGEIIAVIDPSRPGEIYQSSPVRSSITGSILQLPFVLGDQVSTSQAVAVVGDLSSLVLETYIPERFSQSMRTGLGAEVYFDSLPDEVFKASINEVSPIIDPASRTLRIRLVFIKPDPRIKSGMFASISLVTASRSNIPVLPREAVINTYGTWIVFVINDTDTGTTALRREVTTGMENETLVEIVSGIKTGERVVISGQNFLSDGDAVRIVE
ncbi:MAG: efflux RND transporter periplasmic adaptor subunit [Spirochaetaceae bacterium]|jgi:multidrug efflux pump subunit AcrA (membrane-fusion protein)|nr:efflux RND transporter periplasmic adaptor subunit [Spirochaetaceae bacterium]